MVTKLKCRLHGLAPSPALWYGTINRAFLGIGLTSTASDPFVQVSGREGKFVDPNPLSERHLTQQSQAEGGVAVEEGTYGPLRHD